MVATSIYPVELSIIINWLFALLTFVHVFVPLSNPGPQEPEGSVHGVVEEDHGQHGQET